MDSDSNAVIGGDFNCPLDPTIDKKGSILIPRQQIRLRTFKMNSVSMISGVLRIRILAATHGVKALLSSSADLTIGLFRTN